MKKSLVFLAGLALSTGLYAQNCYDLTNRVTTIGYQSYVLNGSICKSDGTTKTAIEPIEKYIIGHADGTLDDFTNKILTFDGETFILVQGSLMITKAEPKQEEKEEETSWETLGQYFAGEHLY